MIDLPRARLALLAAVLLPASASATPAGDTPHGGGALLDVAVEHYLPRWPLRLSLELSPLALSMPLHGRDAGSALVGHLRLGAALATKYVEVGASAGSHLQENGASGFSLAGTLRLGTLDGLRLDLGYGHVLARDQDTGLRVIGLASVTARLQVPLGRSVSAYLEAGASDDLWMHTTLGLRHRLTGDGGPGTWIISGSFGLAWVLDRPACQLPGTGWCATSSRAAAGPVVGVGIERRF
jgi:hypothetical protein